MSNLSGTSFLDVNGDGVLGPNDQRLTGATVFTDLTPFNAALDAGELSGVTNANGEYVITGLETLGAGTAFQLQQALPAGVTTSGSNLPVDLSVPADATANLGPIPIVNSVFVPPVPPVVTTGLGNIQGITYVDNNTNAIFDLDEPVVGGIPLFLDLDGNEVRTANEPIAVSEPSGFYYFNNLTPGTYQVRSLVPLNDVPSDADLALVGLPPVTPFAADFEATNTIPQNVTVFSGSVTFQDLGYVVPNSIYGFAIDDLNGNGLVDAGEPGIPGITVTGGGETALTDRNGLYVLENLDTGLDAITDEDLAQNPYLLYTLDNNPAVLATSFPVEATSPSSSIVLTNPLPGVNDFDIALAPNQSAQKNFFFSTSPSLIGAGSVPDSVTGFVFTDVNINSAYELGEPLIEGATVYIDINNNGQLDGGSLTVFDPVTGTSVIARDGNGNPLPAEPSTVTLEGGNYGIFDVSRWFSSPGLSVPPVLVVRAEDPAGLPFQTTAQPIIAGDGLAVLAASGASGVPFGFSEFPIPVV